MEDTLRVIIKLHKQKNMEVLILVLMEDTLREIIIKLHKHRDMVLILVLMEDTLRDTQSAEVTRR